MTEKVRLGAIGLGWWGGVLAEAANASGQAEIVSCYARTEATRNEFAAKHSCQPAASLDELLDSKEISGVLVATPHSTHADIVEQAAAAGKHVFVEKPLTLTVSEGRRAIESASKHDVVLQVGHHRRRQPATRRIHQLVEAGALGQISLLEANLSGKSGLNPRSGWRGDPEECPLGGMTGMGVHMADNLIYLVGPVRAVSTISKKTLARGPLDDATSLALEFESGAVGYLGTSTVIPKTCTTVAFGSEGAAWSEEEGQMFYRQGIEDNARHQEPVDGPDALVDELTEFADCIRTGRSPEVGGEEALLIVALLEAACLSHDRAEMVELGEVLK
ncbi:MAG TPA: Gfo/Idh/MocA family oxidoreductase [Acidimicrobiia bacterium]|nr:Gfo/Idh/MocA family oxidoreductase [Acidimicrobiia bacterium]